MVDGVHSIVRKSNNQNRIVISNFDKGNCSIDIEVNLTDINVEHSLLELEKSTNFRGIFSIFKIGNSDLQSFGDELNRSSKTSHADI